MKQREKIALEEARKYVSKAQMDDINKANYTELTDEGKIFIHAGGGYPFVIYAGNLKR